MGGIISLSRFNEGSRLEGPGSLQATEPSVSISNPDIIRLIFNQLEQDDRVSAAQVCGAWRSAADDPRIWSDVEVLLSLSHSPGTPVLQSLRKRGVERVKVANPADELTLLASLLENLPCLKSLDLSHCRNLTDECVGKTFGPRLCTSLRSLNLSWCSKVTDDAVECITRQLPNLEVLYLTGCGSVGDRGMWLIGTRLRNLKVLEVRACDISNAGLKHIAGFTEDGHFSDEMGVPQLEQLNLRFCLRVTDAGLESISLGMGHLMSLDLRRCGGVTDEGVGHVAKIATLKRLILHRCILVTGQGIRHLASRPFSLDELDVGSCRRIGKGITNIFKGAGIVGVTKLYAHSCSGVSDKVLGTLARTFLRLTELDISECGLITCHGIAALSTYMRELRRISLHSCHKLTDRALSYLSRMPSLRTVSLKNCRQITGQDVSPASGDHTQVHFTELDLGYTGVGDSGLCYITEVTKIRGLLVTNYFWKRNFKTLHPTS
ncbi:hypothetical protein HPB48_019169 [Haemaphysalis longicornis]|uniref:F-box domain-containing protein n=1 Tax=Haemaphysalis longicornis TaxID=44386 RepID=A0A9J6GDF0_HAELO|nr:hypothetical protein HPB48_019169 [Haemaphysalis longicornis]